MPPEAEIISDNGTDGILRFFYGMLPNEDTAVLRARIDQQLQQLEVWVSNVNQDLAAFNRSIRATVTSKQKLGDKGY